VIPKKRLIVGKTLIMVGESAGPKLVHFISGFVP
jgi:hypothetical protein